MELPILMVVYPIDVPVDVLTYRAWQRTGWDRSRVYGQAGVLDPSRMEAFIAMETTRIHQVEIGSQSSMPSWHHNNAIFSTSSELIGIKIGM